MSSVQILWLILCVGAAGGTDQPPTPAQALAAFRLADPELRIELIASEPRVADPVAIAWDEHGVLFVAEMGDYPTAGPAGRIRRLQDRDGDGIYEHATAFAESLAYPSGILPWKQGLIVTAAPDVLFLADRDGDGVAEEKRVLLTGFAEGNQQLRVNSPTWGLDGWVYLANGRSGGLVRVPHQQGHDPRSSEGLSIDRHDMRFDPDRPERMQRVGGFSQYGLARDDWGDRFPSWNTVPIRHVLLGDVEVASDSPFSRLRLVSEILDLADGGRIFSLAPAQTRFNGETVAYFNASCGPAIYRDRVLGEKYAGDAFVCEPLTSVVHRRKLHRQGVSYRAERADEGMEFLASTHPWFRPVNLATGPEGALYVVDFCRAWVEHPAFVPEDKRDSVDFREGHERGRIWRIVPRDGVAPVREWPGALSDEARVELLDSNNGWVRDTAHRLLVERALSQNAMRKLEEKVTGGPTPAGRVAALWILNRLERLDASLLERALRDTDPRVREQAARVGLRGAYPCDLTGLVDDPDPRVRLQAALAAVRAGVDGVEVRARLAARDLGDAWINQVLLLDLDAQTSQVRLSFAKALMERQPRWLADPSVVEADFLFELGALMSLPELRAMLGAGAPESLKPAGAFMLAAGVFRDLGTRRADGPDSTEVEQFRVAAHSRASDQMQPVWLRVRAVQALGSMGHDDRTDALLLELLNPTVDPALQLAAATTLVETAGRNGLDALLERWEVLPVSARQRVLALMTQSVARAEQLIAAVEAETIPAADLDRQTLEALRQLPSADLMRRLENLPLAAPLAGRQDVLTSFAIALSQQPDVERGSRLFEQHCQTCHARDGRGARLGPDLIAQVGRPASDVLVSLLDPNREVVPDGVGFVVATKTGQIYSGLIVEESASRIVLRLSGGIDQVIPRDELEAVRSTGRSLMPEGFEQSLSAQDVADLIGFLTQPPAAR